MNELTPSGSPLKYKKPDILVATFEQVMTKALRLISMRALTRAELRTKLRNARFPLPLVQAVIEDCIRLRYINDDELITPYIQSLLSQGYGRQKIIQNLKKRGFSPELIQKGEESMDDTTALTRAFERKSKTLMHTDSREKALMKATRYLVGRGFSTGIIRNFLKTQDCFNALPRECTLQQVKRSIKKNKPQPLVDSQTLLQKNKAKLEREPDVYKRKQKAFRLLVSHGTDFDAAKTAIDDFFKNN